MSVPGTPEPDASAKFAGGQYDPDGHRDIDPDDAVDTSDVGSSSGGAEADDVDTNPIPSLGGWNGGWGDSWAPVSRAGDLIDIPDKPSGHPGRRDGARASGENSYLPSPPRSSGFPTPPNRTGRPGIGRTTVIGFGALAALAVACGLIFWLTHRTPPRVDADHAEKKTVMPTTATTLPGPSRDSSAEAQLARMLPPGYPPGACRPVDPGPGARAVFDCDNNADPGGPTAATFTLARDKAALDVAFGGAVPAASVVTCPGKIQSPGPWRRNATPQKASGTLVCGVEDSMPVLAWTDDERMLLSVTRSSSGVPTLEELYQWWSSHS